MQNRAGVMTFLSGCTVRKDKLMCADAKKVGGGCVIEMALLWGGVWECTEKLGGLLQDELKRWW